MTARTDDPQSIAVIGTGYVGLVTAAGFAELGHDVWCVDVDASKIERLVGGEIPIYEPGLADCVARNGSRLHFSTELGPALEHARLLFVAVGTPPTYSGDADLSAVRAVVDAMPATDRHALVMKSTVPVGTGASIKREFARQGKGFAYVSCPEFLKEGAALADFMAPDRVVVGDDSDWAGDAVAELYAPLDAPLVRTDIASAEMVKLASNAFLATKISFINEIANVCEETGADVMEVARGMGLDRRIGEHFLRPGIGYGGSCFAPEETVLVRHRGRTTLVTLERLWQRIAAGTEQAEDGVLEPGNLEVLSWVPGGAEPQFLGVMCLTRRDYDGELVDVRTKTGRRLRTTPDHGWIVSDGRGGELEFKLAGELTTEDWVPLALGQGESWDGTKVASLLGAAETAELSPHQLIVRPDPARLAGRLAHNARSGGGQLTIGPATRTRVVKSGRMPGSTHHRSGDQDARGEKWPSAPVSCQAAGGDTVRSRDRLRLDERFWRVLGLYLADGYAAGDASEGRRITWSFDPTREQQLVDEVIAYWLAQNVRADVRRTATAQTVSVSSRLVVTWWTEVLGLGRNRDEQRLPDLIWEQPEAARRSLLSGLFGGDDSIGTVSDELADGVLRLLGSVGVVARRGTGRAATATKGIHRIRIAPTGHRRLQDDGPAWVRVTSTERVPYCGPVYSLEVPYAHTVVASGGVTVSNCFPKDVSALKQLAGNSGYHFQLLTSVIEVNELQKRRVIGKLQKHLGSLVGRRVALLGLAFKANTDDMREASSLVLAARLQADGATVSAYDPVAEEEARRLMVGVSFAGDPLGALQDADAAILVTEWPQFAQLDWDEVRRRMSGTLLVDGRNYVDPATVRAAGLVYEGIGR